ncbi:MAG: PAS domain-containing protein, partial [Solirubrobacterales bacterium]
MNLFSETTQRAPGPDYFQRLAETLPGIIWIARADGSIEYINDEGNAFTGQTPVHTYEWGWMSLLHSDDA